MHNGQNAQTDESEKQNENNKTNGAKAQKGIKQERDDDEKRYDALRSRLSRAINVSCVLYVVCFLFNPLTHRTNVCDQGKKIPKHLSVPDHIFGTQVSQWHANTCSSTLYFTLACHRLLWTSHMGQKES